MKIKDFFFSEVLNTLEIGHVRGGQTCSTGGTTCTCVGNDHDDANGDYDIPDEVDIDFMDRNEP